MVAHIGVSLLAFGFIASTSFSEEGEFQLSPGEVGTVAGHEVSFVELEDVMAVSYTHLTLPTTVIV